MDEVTFNLYVNDLQGMLLSLLHVTVHGSILDFDKSCVTVQELQFFSVVIIHIFYGLLKFWT